MTNRRCGEPDPERRSRGWLVPEALEEAEARTAADRLERLPDALYNPFNLFVADAETAHLITYADHAERIDLGPGAHVIGNIDPRVEDDPKLRRLRQGVARALECESALMDALTRLCRSHEGDAPLGAACVHAGDYGTRCSTLLRLGEDPVLYHAEGPPCKTRYANLTPLLHDLGFGPRSQELAT